MLEIEKRKRIRIRKDNLVASTNKINFILTRRFNVVVISRMDNRKQTMILS